MVDRDIFGNPVEPPVERRGRPKHKPTDDSRLVVKVLVAANKRVSEIAEALAISEPTLRRAYKSELAHGRAQIRAEVMFRMMEQVKAGNVSAMAHILRQFDKADALDVQRDFDGAEPPVRREGALRRGKKEQAAEDATTAGLGSDWGDDLTRGLSLRPN